MEHNDSAHENEIVEQEADALFWESITGWIAKLFENNEGLCIDVVGISFIWNAPKYQAESDKPELSLSDFKEFFNKETIKTLREEYFCDKYFLLTGEGWVLTTSHDTVMEAIDFLENRGENK